MSDIVEDAKAWLGMRERRGFAYGRTHHPTCHDKHVECLVARLVAQVERHRMTEEERRTLEECADPLAVARTIWSYLDRTAPEEKP